LDVDATSRRSTSSLGVWQCIRFAQALWEGQHA
jgi:hypothetical protein